MDSWDLSIGHQNEVQSVCKKDEEKKGLDRVAMPRPATVMGSRKVVEKEMKLKHSDSEASSSDDENDNSFLQVKGQPGMYYKVREAHFNTG